MLYTVIIIESGVQRPEFWQIGSGKHKVTGLIDMAMVQSLVDKRIVNDLVENYGQVIVDECHHISAASFKQVIQLAKARFITGLTTTVSRQDGHHPIIFKQYSPVRYRVYDRQQAALRSFIQRVIVRRPDFVLPAQLVGIPQPGIQEIYAFQLIADFINLAPGTSEQLCRCNSWKSEKYYHVVRWYGS